jgi:hypothetical protein
MKFNIHTGLVYKDQMDFTDSVLLDYGLTVRNIYPVFIIQCLVL